MDFFTFVCVCTVFCIIILLIYFSISLAAENAESPQEQQCCTAEVLQRYREAAEQGNAETQ